MSQHPSNRPSSHPLNKTNQAFPITQGGQINANMQTTFQQNGQQNQQGQQVQQQNLQFSSNQQEVYNNLRREFDQQKNELNRRVNENRQKDQEIMSLKTRISNLNLQNEKQIEDLKFELTSLRSDKINYKEMKQDLEDEIEVIKKQRTEQLDIHQREVQTLRERQKAVVEDLQEQRRKYDHLHFYLERNAKSFEFEEEQLKSQLKIKDQEIINLEKQLAQMNGGNNYQNKDAMSNLVAENESLRLRLSEMAKQLSNYSDLERKMNDNAYDKREMEIQAIEHRLKLEQEKMIRQRTIEIETQLNRVNQEINFARNNEKIIQQENIDLKEQSRKMMDAVSESVQEVKMWKEKYEKSSLNLANNSESMQLRAEIQMRERTIKDQENQLFRLTSELASFKREYSNRTSNVNIQGQQVMEQVQMRNTFQQEQIQDLQNQNQAQQEVINQLSDQAEETRKKSRNVHHNINTSSVNEQEILERNRRLEATNRQLAEAIADLESKLSKYNEQPARIGQTYSQRGTVQNVQTVQTYQQYPPITVNPPLPPYQYTFNTNNSGLDARNSYQGQQTYVA